MKKNVSAIVREAVRAELRSYFRLALKYIISVIIFAYLFININVSQTVSSLYDRFITEDMQASLELVKKIHLLPEARQVEAMQTDIYGSDYSSALQVERAAIDNKIKEYKDLLVRNPNSRDVLYNLYLLYKYEDSPLAAEYLKKARAVDPTIR